LQFFETKRVVSQSLHGRLLLLHDSKEWIFTNLGSDITSGVGILNCNEVFVCGAKLRTA
jgi:hypothetical protein